MKICLVNPPLVSKPKKNEEWSNYSLHNFQQLGLGYIAASLDEKGYEVNVIDCPCQRISNKEALVKILDGNYDIVGISLFHYNLVNAKRIITKLRMSNKNVFIAAGGYVPTLNPSDTLLSNPDLNCCFIGEGEESIIKFCDSLSDGKDWRDNEGIAYIEDGKVIVRDFKQAITDLDSLVFPRRIKNKNHSRTLSILTSRGCYGNCSFCSERNFNIINKSRAMRFRSPENVVDEIVKLIETYNPLYININDSNFLEATRQRKVWLQQFIKLMKERTIKQDVKTKFRINTRADDILENRDLLKNIVEIGIASIFIGVESFNQRQLNFYDKRVTVLQNIESIELLKRLDAKIEIGFMIFEPFVKMEEIKENLEILKKLDLIKHLDYNQYFFSSGCKLYAIKGTRIYEDIVNANIAQYNELGYTFIHADVYEYYSLLERWSKIITPYSEYKYLIDKSLIYEDGKLFDKMLRWFWDVMKFDLEVMLELISFVGKSDGEVDELISEKIRKIESIDLRYRDVIELLEE